MNSTGTIAQSLAKTLEALKDFPLWLLTAVAVALGLFLLVPELSTNLPKTYKPWFVLSAVLFIVLAIFRGVSVGFQWWRSWRISVAARRTFHLTPIDAQCFWSATRQSDDSVVTQIAARFIVKNRTPAPLNLISARVIRPVIRGEVIQKTVLVRAPEGTSYGSAQFAGHAIPPGSTLPAAVDILIRGSPKLSPADTLRIKLGIVDDDGNEQRVWIALKGLSPAKAKYSLPEETSFEIADPVQKELVSILRSELHRYDKCGRTEGGLGSVHIVYRGTALMALGSDSWNPRSPKRQSVVDDPDAATLESDNLDAMLALYSALTHQDERNRLIWALLDRMDEKKGYLRISYFIVCVLWKVGSLHDALQTARKALPQGDIKEFGLSNVLVLLNGLLRYRYPDFTAEMLDDIERFIHGFTEHTFMIGEKIATIRALRLLTSEKTAD